MSFNFGFTLASNDEEKKKPVIILVKAGWCTHCKNFSPIYDKIKEEFSSSHPDVLFLSFDIADDDNRKDLIRQYNYIYNANNGKGVPSVYGIKDNKYKLIPHYNNDDVGDTDLKDPKSIFIKNLNLFINSELGKDALINQGGGSLNNKYLKYKSKYLQLKNNM
jgi:thiol-disulfide isomerase/thioredoxin